MALFNCPECNKSVSDKAKACIHCGYPLEEMRGEQTELKEEVKVVKQGENENKLTLEKKEVDQWFFVKNSERNGPVSKEVIIKLYKQEELDRHSKVWNKEMSDWLELKDTDLIKNGDIPPVVSGSDVSNTLVWLLVAVPFIGFILEAMLSTSVNYNPIYLGVGLFIINSILCVIDERKLKKTGNDTRELLLWAVTLLPLYLYRRAKLLKQNMGYLIAWCLVFSITVVGPMLASDYPVFSNSAIAQVKGGYLDAYPEKSLGEILDSSLDDIKWESIQAEDNNTYVNVTGDLTVFGESAQVLIQYKVLENKRFIFHAIEINELPQNVFVYNALITLMYNEQDLEAYLKELEGLFGQVNGIVGNNTNTENNNSNSSNSQSKVDKGDYYDEEHKFSIDLPDWWKGKYLIDTYEEEGVYHVVFSFEKDGEDTFLLSIDVYDMEFSEDDLYNMAPFSYYIAARDGKTFVYTTPTEAPYGVFDEATVEEFINMVNDDVPVIIDSIKFH